MPFNYAQELPRTCRKFVLHRCFIVFIQLNITGDPAQVLESRALDAWRNG